MNAVFVFALLCCASVLATTPADYQNAFVNFMQTYKKSYNHDEFQYRYQVFKANYDFITGFDAEARGFTVSVNQFADLSSEEFGKLYNGMKMTYSPVNEDSPVPEALPASWNWNTQGAVTPIKNQQQCGSCWAFSTTGSTEGCHFISTKSLVSLSEQQLVDCSEDFGNGGCEGGLMTEAMLYIIHNKGIDTEASYPYTAETGPQCLASKGKKGATLSGMVNVTSGDEGDLQVKVYAGPVSVGMDASQSSFQFYTTGIYSDPDCSSTQLDHGVLATGWGVSKGKNYWVVKNSWGTSWGQAGWFWMAKNDHNMCGIATSATLPKC